LDNSAMHRVMELIRAEDFYREAHRRIFAAMVDLYQRGEPIDLVTLTETLKVKEMLDEVGGPAYLAALLDSVPTALNVDHYARIVRSKSVLRRLIHTATRIASQAYEASEEELGNLLDRTEQAIFEIAEDRIRPSYFPLREVIKEAFKAIEGLYERRELITGVPTGFVDLDRLTCGLQPSELAIVAGRPGMGKTAFCLNVALHAALEAKVPVAIFSLEMSREQLAVRLLCCLARVDSHRLRSGALNRQEWERLTQAAGVLFDVPIYIDDTPALSVLELRAKARRLKAEHNIGLVMVDYLQLMRCSDADTREQEISEISHSLKALAKELNIPVLAVSQLNRRVEDRQNKRPQLADLRESGSIEQDADLIAFLYRDELYNRSPDNPQRGIAEVIVGKQRNGPLGEVKLAFLDKYTRFESLSSYRES